MRTSNIYKSTQRNGFTMLELVFVIVVLGILAVVALPRLDRDNSQGAANTVLSNIRYTQHLALNDYKHRFDSHQWQQRFWKIAFSTCANGDVFFRIGSDDDMDSGGTFEEAEAAIDPTTGKPIYAVDASADCENDTDVSSEIFLSHRFGVTAYDDSGCNDLSHIGFDHLGRPHQGFGNSASADYSSYMDTNCTFTFTMSNGETFGINIAQETGAVQIVGLDGS